MHKIIRKMMRFMPKFIRFSFIRNMFELPISSSEDLRLKIAHRKHELEQAFNLLYDAYLAEGFTSPNDTKIRVTKYHALPSTTTLVAMEGETVVGTVSVIRDGLFGFPSDSLIDKKDLRNTGVRIAEVSSLAVHKDYKQKSRGAILWPLIAMLVRYSKNYFGVDYFVIAVHPRHFDFYEGILFFDRLTPKVIDDYSFVNNNPAICGLLNLRKFYSDLERHYGKNEDSRNLFKYVFQTPHKFLRFPKREHFKISDPFLTPQLIEYFFQEKTKIFESMTPREIAVLHTLYTRDDYRAVLPEVTPHASPLLCRRTVRFDVSCHGRVDLPGRKINVKVLNVSGEGLSAFLEEDIRFGSELELAITVGYQDVTSLVVLPVWTDQSKYYGFKILKSDLRWSVFIKSLYEDLNQDHTQPPHSLISSAI